MDCTLYTFPKPDCEALLKTPELLLQRVEDPAVPRLDIEDIGLLGLHLNRGEFFKTQSNLRKPKRLDYDPGPGMSWAYLSPGKVYETKADLFGYMYAAEKKLSEHLASDEVAAAVAGLERLLRFFEPAAVKKAHGMFMLKRFPES